MRRFYSILTSKPNIAFVMLAFSLWLHADYEDRLFDAFVAECTSHDMTDREKSLAIMEKVHDVVQQRERIFNTKASKAKLDGVRTRFLRSGDLEFTQATGACGSYAGMFVEACQRADISARLCQMQVGGKTVHILAEVELGGHWAVVDPQFRQTFQDANGHLVGYAEVSSRWAQYRSQAAPEYEEFGFTFDGVRYTNWEKVPVLMPAFKSILNMTMGRAAADQLSLRSYCLNVHKVYFFAVILLSAIYNAGSLILRRPKRGEESTCAPAPGSPDVPENLGEE